MLSNDKSRYNDKEIIEMGSKALIKELGYAGFLRFIRQVENNSREDYLKIQNQLYENQSVDEIFREAEENWEE